VASPVVDFSAEKEIRRFFQRRVGRPPDPVSVVWRLPSSGANDIKLFTATSRAFT
jgi:hypothetical protein